MSLEYWKMCLSEVEATLGFTDAQIEQLAKDCMNIAEMQSECTGAYLAPNPLQAEIDNLKRRHERELIESERKYGVMRGVLAAQLRCEPMLLRVDGNMVIQNRR